MGLVICVECNRHFRRRESHCPFCSAEIPSEVTASPERPLPAMRLSRAALLAFAAASVGTACGGKDTDTGSSDPSNGGSGGTGAGGVFMGASGDTSVPVYGAPIGGAGSGGRISSGGAFGKGGFPGSGGIFNPPPPYGAPPPPPPPTGGTPGFDAGDDGATDAGEIVRDAGSKD